MWWIYLRDQKIQNRILYCIASDERSIYRTTNETLNRYFILCEFPCVVHIVPTIIIKTLNVYFNDMLQRIKNGNFMFVIKYANGIVWTSVSSELNNDQFEHFVQHIREFL